MFPLLIHNFQIQKRLPSLWLPRFPRCHASRARLKQKYLQRFPRDIWCIHRQIIQQTVLNFHGLFFSFLCRHFRIWEYLVFYRLSVMMELWIFELFFGVFSGFCRIHIHRNPFLWDNNSTFNKQVPTRLPILDVLEDSNVL